MTLFLESEYLHPQYQSASGSSLGRCYTYQEVLDFMNAYDGCAFE